MGGLRRYASSTTAHNEKANSGWPVWAPTGHRLAIDSDPADPDPQDDIPVNAG